MKITKFRGELNRMRRQLTIMQETIEKTLEELPRPCQTCDNFEYGKCVLADAAPPEEVQEVGCEKWKEKDEIPF